MPNHMKMTQRERSSRKCRTHAKVFHQTLADRNSKNEINQRNRRTQAERINIWRGTKWTSKKDKQMTCYSSRLPCSPG